MEFKRPNLMLEYFLSYKKEFLELNNLKVGDEIDWKFNHDTRRSINRKGEQGRYSCSTVCKGILKEDENGVLYFESVDNLDFYNWVDNGRMGRGNKSHLKLDKRKAIHYPKEAFASAAYIKHLSPTIKPKSK